MCYISNIFILFYNILIITYVTPRNANTLLLWRSVETLRPQTRLWPPAIEIRAKMQLHSFLYRHLATARRHVLPIDWRRYKWRHTPKDSQHKVADASHRKWIIVTWVNEYEQHATIINLARLGGNLVSIVHHTSKHFSYTLYHSQLFGVEALGRGLIGTSTHMLTISINITTTPPLWWPHYLYMLFLGIIFFYILL